MLDVSQSTSASGSASPRTGQYADSEWGFALVLEPTWSIEIVPSAVGRAVVAKDHDRFIEVIAEPADPVTDGDPAITRIVVAAARARGLDVPDIGPIALPQALDGHDGRQFTFTLAPNDRLDALSASVGRARFVLLAHGKGAFQAVREGFRMQGE